MLKIKKQGIVFLAMLVLFQCGAGLFLLKIEQVYVQYKMYHKLNRDDVKTEKIILSGNAYKTSRVSATEIEYNGKLYDVISVVFHLNQVELRVINDTEEESILQSIFVLSKQQQKTDRIDLFPFQMLLTLQYVEPEAQSLWENIAANICNGTASNQNIIAGCIQIISPPPKKGWVFHQAKGWIILRLSNISKTIVILYRINAE